MKKWLVVGAGLVIVLGLAGTRMAFGATGPFGRNYYTGYLTGRPATGIGWVAPATKDVPYFGLLGMDSTPTTHLCQLDQCTVTLNSFLTNYYNRLHDASSLVDRGRAAATIDVMLNVQDPAFQFGTVQKGIDYAVTNYTKWADLVTAYANSPVSSGYYVEWNANPDFTNFHRNAMGLNNAKSGINGCGAGQKCYPDITFIGNLNDPGRNHAVIFHAPGGFKFFIKHKCANLTGDTRGLPNWKLTGTSNVTPTTVHPLDNVTFVHTIHNSAGSDTATFDYTVKYKFPPSGVYQSRTAVNNVTLASGANKRVNDPAGAPLQIPLGAQDGDTYCEYISFTNATGPNSGPGTSSPVCVTVAVLSTPTCGSARPNKASIDPSTVFDVNITVDYPVGGASAAKAAGDQLYMQVTGPTYSYGPKNAAPTVSAGDNALTHTFTGVGPTNKAGTFTINYGVKDSSGVVLLSCSPTFVIAYGPYFVVNGGDVQAGNCMSTVPDYDTNASVVSWNQENPGYAGAGTQYAALALGYLQDFVTAQSNPPGSGLGFANAGLPDPGYVSTTGSGSDTYGGGFGNYQSCVPEYYDSSNSVPGGYPQPGVTLGNGTHKTVYVNGDAYITGDIMYTGGGYANVADIPSFSLIVKGGDIYIASNVTKLSGLYVAEPDGAGKGGTIYTCATGVAPPLVAAGLDNNLFNSCQQPLTVTGAFIARQVQLLRTHGTLHDNSAQPAETFNYNPELWLGNTAPGGNAGNKVDAISSLPPAL